MIGIWECTSAPMTGFDADSIHDMPIYRQLTPDLQVRA